MPLSVTRWSVPFDLLKRTAAEWSSDNATRWSASVAFDTLLSLAPLLVITVSIAGFVYGKKDAQAELQFGLRNLLGPDVAPAIQMLLTSPRKQLSGFIAVLYRYEYQTRTAWHSILCWNKLAIWAASLENGAHLEIEGELRYRVYTRSESDRSVRVAQRRTGNVRKGEGHWAGRARFRLQLRLRPEGWSITGGQCPRIVSVPKSCSVGCSSVRVAAPLRPQVLGVASGSRLLYTNCGRYSDPVDRQIRAIT